jgi:DNA-binding response OmpR family regulator
MSARPRAILIEDDEDIRALLCELLDDCDVDAIPTTHHAPPELASVALVVTDLPPRSDGYSSDASATWVRALVARYGAPVLVVTGATEAASDEALASAATAVLAKPFDVDDVTDHVRRLVGSRSAPR